MFHRAVNSYRLYTAEKPPLDWPQSGTICFEKVNLKYDQSGQLVLKDISFTVKSKEKVIYFNRNNG